MLIEPKIVERPATHYAAVARDVRIPFGEVIGQAMGEVVACLDGAKVEGFGPAVFRYNLIEMPRLQMEFGFITPGPVAGTLTVKPGILPAGKYVMAVHIGHYDNVEKATGEVLAWARTNRISWDSTPERGAERFVSRFEIYPNGPDDEPDPNKWITEIWIKTMA
jgi:effector-binding domain-containing protein